MNAKPLLLASVSLLAGLSGGIGICRWQPEVFSLRTAGGTITVERLAGVTAGEPVAGGAPANVAALAQAPAGPFIRLDAGNARALQELTTLYDAADAFGSSAGIRARLAGLSGAECAALAGQIESIRTYTPSNSAVSSALMEIWSEKDPDGVLKWATSSEGRIHAGFALQSLMSKVGARDLNKARTMLKTITDPELKRTALYGLSTAAGNNPAGIARLMEEESSPGDWSNSYALGQVMSTWALQDANAAASYVAAMKSSPMKERAISGLAGSWATADFDAAWKWANGLGNQRDRNQAMPAVLSSLAGVDPSRAAGLALKLPSGQIRDSALAEVSQSWIYRDREGMLSWLDTLPAQDRSKAISESSWYLAYSDPEKAIELYDKLPAGGERGNMMRNVMYYLAGKEPEKGIQILEKIPAGSSRSEAMGALVGRWAATDPKKAAAWLEKQDGPGFSSAAAQLVSQWGQEDPAAALKWALAHQSGSKEDFGFAATALSTMAANDPEKAAEQLKDVTEPKLRQQMLETLASSWAGSSLGDAEKWAATLPAADQRLALRSVAGMLANSQPEEASRLLTQLAGSAGDSRDLQDTASRIASSRASYAAADAITWAQSLPETLQPKAIEGAIGQWVSNDRAGVSQWITEQPRGAVRDNAAGQLVQQLAYDDPESAFTWSADISDPEKLRTAADKVLDSWGSRDPARIQEAITQSTLPAEEQQRLLGKLENR